ncbi:Hypothetical_protein [Hexamita inflata]|uniref:Hypothetical_protein n=1 Tax=Hexamita inflata TaxID=28002 RepID=A0AA86QIY1_9EUKA|nr:Hypothetical protein HINF_LOCUS22892 [Hexamita inflata]CAI9960226.1 Hypothetical protein HINF_LOCUS47871 [Hexamita inflata]
MILIYQALTCYSNANITINEAQLITIDFYNQQLPVSATCAQSTGPLIINIYISEFAYVGYQSQNSVQFSSQFQQIQLKEADMISLTSQTYNKTLNQLSSAKNVDIVYSDTLLFTSQVQKVTKPATPVPEDKKASVAIIVCIALFGIALPIALLIVLGIWIHQKHHKDATEAKFSSKLVNTVDNAFMQRHVIWDLHTDFPEQIIVIMKKAQAHLPRLHKTTQKKVLPLIEKMQSMNQKEQKQTIDNAIIKLRKRREVMLQSSKTEVCI